MTKKWQEHSGMRGKENIGNRGRGGAVVMIYGSESSSCQRSKAWQENIQMVNLIYPTQTLTRRTPSHTMYQLLLLRAWWDTTAHSHTDTSSFDKCAEVFAPRRLRRLGLRQKFGWVNNWQYKNDDLWVSQFLAITKFD